ncbi:hypothetical protein GWJ21_11385 [Bacillus coagulans]|uniref:hypothetical protein n=1 Tax=Heyndrickxia coagulans TaxID=1398 RepID=UPI00030D5220|nr:hypothetical protein [Heyndrickxia coagulans]NCG68535.1 hypothetical protein [Heyndrickxia coagulans]
MQGQYILKEGLVKFLMKDLAATSSSVFGTAFVHRASGTTVWNRYTFGEGSCPPTI